MANTIVENRNILNKLRAYFTQTSLVIIGDAITYGANFLSIMVLARLLPINVMGTYRQLIYLGAFFIQLFECGLTNSIYRFWNTLEHEQKKTFSKMVLGFLIISGTIAAIVLVSLSTAISQWYQNPELENFIKIVALYPLASMVIMIVRPILISDGHSIFATGIETIFAVLSFFALSIPVYYKYSFEDSLRIWILVLLFRLIIVPVLIRKYVLSKGKLVDKRLIGDVIEYIWPIQAARIPGILMSYFDKIYMSLLLNPIAFAIYSLGAREIPFIGTVGYSVSNVLIPKLVRDNNQNNIPSLLSKWKSACRKTALFTYLPMAFCVIFAELVINFLFSSTYAESTGVFRIFACITFFRVIEYASLAKTIGESKLILKVALAGLGVIILLAYPMTRIFGPVGMALAIFISTLVSVIYFLIWYKRYFKVPLQNFYPLSELLRYLIYAFIGTGLVKLVFSQWAQTGNSSIFLLMLHIVSLLTISVVIYISFIFLDNKIFNRAPS